MSSVVSNAHVARLRTGGFIVSAEAVEPVSRRTADAHFVHTRRCARNAG